MFTLKRVISGSLFVFVLAGTALAQEKRAPIEMPREPVAPIPAAPLVTATATAERVRFVSPGTVVQLRLEVYNETGQKLFDTELHGGNVLDWHLQDGAGERLPAGSYACVLTIKSLSGRLSQRVGLVTVNDKKAAIEAAGVAQLSMAQQQTIGPVEGNAAFTILQESEAEAITAVTHDGAEGQLTSTTGALTFRTGDLFSGKDVERVRITPAGNVGIGTDKPEAKLDVAGAVRATEGFRFSDGTTLDAAGGKITLRDAAGDTLSGPSAAGTGTVNRLAKWAETGGTGTLTDSTVTETGGQVGIGTTTPASMLHLAGPSGVAAITFNTPGSHRFRFQTIPGIANWGALTLNANFNFPSGWLLDEAATNGWFFKLDTRGGNNSGVFNGLWLYRIPSGAGFHTDEVPVFGVSSGHAFFAGNVGIGTTAPTAVLNVVGSQPPQQSVGLNASPVLRVIGGNGGDGFSGAGDGALVLIQAGNGGSAAGGVGRNGASITLQPGSPGVGILASGAAGNVLLAPSVGNVGIGTAAPSVRLHVRDNEGNILLGNAGCASGFVGIGFGANLSGCNNYSLLGDGTDTVISRPTNGTLYFREGNTTQMSIAPGGNVGIGNFSPTAKLQVAGGDAAVTTQGNGLILRASDGPKCFRVTVNNVGTLSAAEVTCP